jgi:hypothetical protein
MDLNLDFIVFIRLLAFMFLHLEFSGSYRRTEFVDEKYHVRTERLGRATPSRLLRPKGAKSHDPVAWRHRANASRFARRLTGRVRHGHGPPHARG